MANIKSFNFKNPVFIGLLLGILILIAIIGIYYYMFFSPLKVTLSQKESSLRLLKTKYNSYLLEVRSYPILVKKEKEIKKEFAKLIVELPSKKDIPGLLMKIANYEKILHLSLGMFKPGKVISKSFYEVVPFSMNISGSFFNVYKFFYKLANMKRIVDVHDVSMSKQSSKHKISVSFKGTTFSFIGVPPTIKSSVGKVPLKKANMVKGVAK
jgi:type IV pilus assembly protein PilO